jgi:hypothetical protein
MARFDLVRHQLFRPRVLNERIEAPARGAGESRSKILGEALGSFLDRKGADEVEPRFIARLDRSGRPAFLPEGDR